MRLEIEVGGRVRVVEIEHRDKALFVRLDGHERVVDAAELGGGRWSLRFPDSGTQQTLLVTPGSDAGAVDVLVDGLSVPTRIRSGVRDMPRVASASPGGRVIAPMPGKVVKLLVAVGQQVTARQGVVVVEAMKMENELRASRDGVVRDILVAEGASVDAGATLVVIG